MKLKEMVEAHRAETKRLQGERDLAYASELEAVKNAMAAGILTAFNEKFSEEIPIIEEAGIITKVLVYGDDIPDLQGTIQLSKDGFDSQAIRLYNNYVYIYQNHSTIDCDDKIDFLSFLYDNFIN